MNANRISRRRALKKAITAGAGLGFVHLVPRCVLGGPGRKPPSEKLNIAGIGVGGQGFFDLTNLAADNNIVALCDVDDRYAAKAYQQWPRARRHRDFRVMLDGQSDIDAVSIATPDHLHCVAAMTAIRHGKHVYCQKPLAHTIAETRRLAEAARGSHVATQMGNQGNAGEGVRLIQEWLEDGAIGAVREVQCWTDKPECPTGMGRPKETPPVAAGLDWDLWLGPAPQRPYHPAYLPFKWRSWWDFGSCALGDMACHVMNTPWRALDLGIPVSVEAHSRGCNEETGPTSSIIYFEFPARGKLPPVRLTWFDGGMMPPWPAGFDEGRRLGDNEGCLFIGERGAIVCSCYGQSPRIIPEMRMREVGKPRRRIPRSPGHYAEWIAACKGGPKAGSHFELAARLTEVVQLGNVALRTAALIEQERRENGHCVKLLWNHEQGRVTNIPLANDYLQTAYRKGWEI